MGQEESRVSSADRWEALDRLRGLTILLMLPVNAGMEYEAMPAWLKHAPGAGLGLADFIMPAFLFALGLSSSLSLRRRLVRRGPARAAAHALARSGLLFAFGTIGYFLVWEGRSWEILQMLGETSALALPFLFLDPAPRAVAALCLVGAVEAGRASFFDSAFRAWYSSGIGGPAGAIPLAAVAIAASALGDGAYRLPPLRRAAVAAAAGGAALAAGLALSLFQAPDKHLLTAGYLFLTTGAASLALGAIEAIGVVASRRGPSAGPRHGAIARLLGALGRNSLFAYMAGGVLTLAARAGIGPEAGGAAAWAGTLAVPAAVSLACLIMDGKRIYLKL